MRSGLRKISPLVVATMVISSLFSLQVPVAQAADEKSPRKISQRLAALVLNEICTGNCSGHSAPVT
jgi:hypothetical protein